jgi:uncharacterized protein
MSVACLGVGHFSTDQQLPIGRLASLNLPLLHPDRIVARTRTWLERAVIGLNLCPFAKAVHLRDQIRYVVSTARTTDELLDDLERELKLLSEESPEKIETTLLVHPFVLNDFLDYNDFLDVAERTVDALGLEGVLQVASFHPDYQFAGTAADDVTNFTNRSPYPTLHLLREDSVEAAVAAYPDPSEIYRKNIETLRRLGRDGWSALGIESERS